MFRNKKKYATENNYIIEQLKANPSLMNFEKIHQDLGITKSQLMNRYVLLREHIIDSATIAPPLHVTTFSGDSASPIALEKSVIEELKARNSQSRIKEMLNILVDNYPKEANAIKQGIYSRDLLVLAMMAFAPIRASELANLKLEQIIKVGNSWQISVTFRGRTRNIVLPLKVDIHLERYLELRKGLLIEGQIDPCWLLLTAKERTKPAKKICIIHLEQIIFKKTVFHLPESRGFGITGFRAIYFVAQLRKIPTLESLISIGHILGISFQTLISIYLYLRPYVCQQTHNSMIPGDQNE